MTNGFTRTLGATERMRLWFPNINVIVVGRLKGRMGERQLRKAITVAGKKHPLMRARVEVAKDASARFSSRDVPENECVVIRRTEEQGWLEHAEKELKHIWPIMQGPLARFILLQGPESSDLIINAHHSICDGRSLVGLLRDILGFIAEDLDASQIEVVPPVPLDKSVPPAPLRDFLFRLLFQRMNRNWLRKGITFGEEDYLKLHTHFWEEHEPEITYWRLAEEIVESLRARCRWQGVSVNSALYVAFRRALLNLRVDAPDYYKTLLVPVDFRKYLQSNAQEALGLYSSALVLERPIRSKEDYWQVVKDLDKQVRSKLTKRNIFASQRSAALHPSLMDGMAFAMFGDLEDDLASSLADRIEGRMRTGILVSNLGHLDFPARYGDLELVGIVPPVIFPGNADLAVELLTFAGTMNFTLSNSGSGDPRIGNDDIKESMISILMEALA